MEYTEVISRMNVYLIKAAQVCCKWLEPRLKQIDSQDWWNTTVRANLSDLQLQKVEQNNVTTLEGLDLQALLCVLKRNLYPLGNYEYFTNYHLMKDAIRQMFEVRNDWAHTTVQVYPLDVIKLDLTRYVNFMELFGGSKDDINEAKEFRAVVTDPNHANPIRIPEPSDPSVKTVAERIVKQPVKVMADPFIVGTPVIRKSNPTVIGVISAIRGSGDATEYQVMFMDTGFGTYYADQLLLANATPERCNVSIDELKILLTAQQLCNPTNDQLYSLNAARVDFVPYQFRPALKMIHSERPRILVADSVGVGKTIEAGLILRELQARDEDFESVLIICPKPLVAEHKWRSEMKRFDENFTELDGTSLREAINECDKDGAWPAALRKTVLPYSLMTKELLNGKGRQKGLLDLEEPIHFDLVIIDEAHHIRHSDTGAYKVARYFTDNADAVVMLTATPVQTDDDDLYTLLNTLRPDVILDKKTFKEMQEPNAEINAAARLIRHQVENWRSEAAEHLSCAAQTSWGRSVIEDNPTYKKVIEQLKGAQPLDRTARMGILQDVESLHSFAGMINRTRRQDIQNDFCVRRPQSISVHFTPEQQELYDALMEFEAHALSYLHNNVPLEFMMSTLMRQASSCIFGLAPLKGMVSRRLGDILSDYCGEDGNITVSDLENVKMGQLEAEFRTMAKRVIELSENLPQTDEKLDRLLEVVENKSHQENNKIILFSSFRHTLRYVEQHLLEKGYRVAQVNGSVKDEERLALRQRFELPAANENALDILLFTEVGCEGLDYQFCDFMINYDLPWNPMAIEQRIGRIDRRGQKSDTVIICNLVTEGTIDAKIYHRCLERIGIFESSIGECAGILGDMTQQINRAVFDPTLTQQEREDKIEKIADNEVSRANEMKKLEDESKELFGIDISSYVLDRNVTEAENPWIGEQYIQALVTEYFNRVLGEKKNYIQGEGAHKVLNLSGENRATLKNLLRRSNIKKSAMYNQWWSYLKGNDTRIAITFDQEEATRDRNAIFFTAVHPLVKMAAAAELHKKDEVYIELLVDAQDCPVACGDYPFLIEERKIIGLRKEVKIVPISDINLSALDFCDLLESADYREVPDDCTDEQWDKLSKLKREQQQQAVAQLKADVKEKCDYRRAAFLKSYQFRKEDLTARIQNDEDANIRRMHESQLRGLEEEKNARLKELEEVQERTTVEENTLVKGIITVY